MTIEIVPVPCLRDNFAYLVRDEDGATALVDAPEARPVLAALEERGWGLDQIWITHHHDDHVGGLAEIRAAHDVEVVGGRADAHRLPPLDRPVGPDATLELGALRAEVLDVPGHTVGHLAFHMPEAGPGVGAGAGAGAVFTADSLMAMGCGRLFEGTPEQMWSTLGLLGALPGDTRVYSGHDYMETNLRFALSVEPDLPALRERAERDARRRKEGATMDHPTLAEEHATNPMLRAGLPETKAALGMEGASDLDVFAEIRGRRDGF